MKTKMIDLLRRLEPSPRQRFPRVLSSATVKLLALSVLAALGMGGVALNQAPPRAPFERVGIWPDYVRGPAWDVALNGQYAYVAVGEGGLLVLDLSDPAHPQRVGSYSPGGRIERVQIVGGRAYTAARVHRGGGCESDGWRGYLAILDLSDPTHPQPLGTFISGTEIQNFCVNNDRVYMGNVGTEEQSFRIVDISNPARPRALAVSRNLSATALCFSGNTLFAANWSSLNVVDASAAPAVNILTNFDLAIDAVRAMERVGSLLYVVGGAGSSSPSLGVFDISDPLAIRKLGTLALTGAGLGLRVAGDYAYVAMADAGVLTVDIRNPSKPGAVSNCAAPGLASNLALAGGYSYVACYHGGLRVIDVSNPAHLMPIASFDTGSTARQTVVVDSTAYLLSSDSPPFTGNPLARTRLEILDVSDPSATALLGAYESTSVFVAMTVSDKVAYLAGAGNGLEILDCHDPAHPAVLSNTHTTDSQMDPNAVASIQVVGPYAYVAAGQGTFAMWDVTDPRKPVSAGNASSSAIVGRVSAGRAYLSSGSQLQIFDVTNPSTAVSLGSLDMGSTTSGGGIWVGNDLAAVGLDWKGFALVDVKQPDRPVLLGNYDTLGELKDLWIAGNYNYVAEGWEGLEIFDIADRTQPVPIAKVRTLGMARSIQVSGNYAYVVEGGRGLAIFNANGAAVTLLDSPTNVQAALGNSATLRIRAFGNAPLQYQWYAGETGDISHPLGGAQSAAFTTPALTQDASYWVRVTSGSGTTDSTTFHVSLVPQVSLELLGSWPGWRRGPAVDVQAPGNIAYAAVGNAGLWICDVTDPTQPKVLARQPTFGYAAAVAVAEPLVFVIASELEIFDATNPSAPIQIGHMDLNGTESRLRVVGTHLYVQGNSLRLVDISNPSHPQTLGTYQESGLNGNALAVAEPYILLSTENWEGGNAPVRALIAVDASYPTHIQRVSRQTLVGPIVGLNVVSNLAYLVTSPYSLNGGDQQPGAIHIFDLSALPNLSEVKSRSLGNDSISDLCVSGRCAYLASGQGFRILDISNPTSPQSLATWLFPGNSTIPSHVFVAGSKAHVTFGDQGLQLVDISQPASPRALGSVETGGFGEAVAALGTNVFLADSRVGLRVLDVSEPAAPRLTGSYSSPVNFNTVAVTGPQPRVLLSSDTLELLDVSNPALPKVIGTGPVPVNDLRLAGDYAFAMGPDRALHVLDIRNPAQMQEVATCGFGGWTGPSNRVEIAGTRAFLAIGWEGVQVVDIASPTQPALVGAYYTDTDAAAIAIHGDFAILTSSVGLPGVELVDLRNIQQPTRVSKVSLPKANSVALLGPYACVTGEGLVVFDIGDPANPVRVASHKADSETRRLQIVGNTVYVAAGENGLAIYRLTPQLRLQASAVERGTVRLSWLYAAGTQLQYASSLQGPSWQDVNLGGDVNTIDLPVSVQPAFYRLIRR